MIPQNIGAYITGRAQGGVAIVAGGAGDNAEQSGPWVDRQGFTSAKLLVVVEATLAAAATISVAANVQDASDDQGTGAADYGDAHASAVAATGGAGGSTEYAVVELDIDLTTADRYIRAQFIGDCSAGATDTAVVAAVLVLGGADTLPAV